MRSLSLELALSFCLYELATSVPARFDCTAVSPQRFVLADERSLGRCRCSFGYGLSCVDNTYDYHTPNPASGAARARLDSVRLSGCDFRIFNYFCLPSKKLVDSLKCKELSVS